MAHHGDLPLNHNDQNLRVSDADQLMVDYIMKFKGKADGLNFPENLKQVNLCLVSQIAGNAQIAFVLNNLRNTVNCIYIASAFDPDH